MIFCFIAKLFPKNFACVRAASKAVAQALALQSETPLPLTPASPPVEAKAPTTTPSIRPVLTPSASTPSYVCPASLLVVLVGITVLYI